MMRAYSGLFKYLHILSYLILVWVWFSPSFAGVGRIRLPLWPPLVLFLFLSIYRLTSWLRHRSRKPKESGLRRWPLLLGILSLAVLIRIPFLAHHTGFTDGDDGLIILQAKHIAEGERPSVFNYGVVSESSTLMHVYALLFKLFGYSLLSIRICALEIYLMFISLQFVLLERLFSPALATAASLFYSLPIGHTLIVSMNLSGDFPSILFLGSLIFFLACSVCFGEKENLIPFLGFTMGLAFWVHQMNVSAILTGLLVFSVKYKLQIKKYLTLAGYGLMGGFPVVLSEIFTGFKLTKFLLGQSPPYVEFSARLQRGLESLIRLLSRSSDTIGYLGAALIGLGLIGLSAYLWKRRKLEPHAIYMKFFLVIALIFLFSKFSARYALSIRYLYPIYIAVPVFLFSFTLLIKEKYRLYPTGMLLLFLIFGNIRGYYEDYASVKEADSNVSAVVAAMQETGNIYWLGDFWDSFTVTALAGEKVMGSECTPYSLGHYPQYGLRYYNQNQRHSIVVLDEPGIYSLAYREMLDLLTANHQQKLKRAAILVDYLKCVNSPFTLKRIGRNLLIFDIREDLITTHLTAEFMQRAPKVTLKRSEDGQGVLILIFGLDKFGGGYGYRIFAEIPGYSKIGKPIPPGTEEIRLRLPYPEGGLEKAIYYCDYKGLRLPASYRELSMRAMELPSRKKRPRSLILKGSGPVTEAFGMKHTVLEKDVVIEINPGPLFKKIRLSLLSPFDFADPSWYGNFAQEIDLWLDGRFLRTEILRDGTNSIEIVMEDSWDPQKTRTELALRFKYHLPFPFMPAWQTAALFEDIVIE